LSDKLELVKKLREITGAGFLDCKKALTENNYDIDSSIDFLRKKGLLKATKKSSREAKEGAIGIFSNKEKTILLKINSETDFAAKSEKFLNFFNEIGNISLSIKEFLNVEKFLNSIHNEKKISEYFNELIAVIGENILLRGLQQIDHKEKKFNFYVHNPYKKNIGKIISLLVYNSSKEDEFINNFSKNLCMHIAALKPEALDIDLLDPEYVLKEKNFQLENIKSSGKPENIIEKILEGKMKKFYSESTLLNQQYVIDQDKTVKQVIDELPKDYSFNIIDYRLVDIG
tara:strand:+ start:342 stop:1199 length:858 start_codon:yes stop_codon:yes gene_type:complete